MTGTLNLNDLTKKELIALIVYRGLNWMITDSDIRRVRFDSLIKKQRVMADDALAEMKANHGSANYGKYKKAADKFDAAMKMHEKACELLNP